MATHGHTWTIKRTALFVSDNDRPYVGPKPTFRIDLPAWTLRNTTIGNTSTTKTKMIQNGFVEARNT